MAERTDRGLTAAGIAAGTVMWITFQPLLPFVSEFWLLMGGYAVAGGCFMAAIVLNTEARDMRLFYIALGLFGIGFTILLFAVIDAKENIRLAQPSCLVLQHWMTSGDEHHPHAVDAFKALNCRFQWG